MPPRKGSRARRRRDPDAAKDALKAAARSLFAQLGFHGTRTEQVAQLANVNKGLITYYFGSKQGLYSTVLLEDITAAQERLRSAIPAHGSASEQLAAFIAAIADFGAERPHFPFILVREQMAGASSMAPSVRQAFFGFYQLTETILGNGIASGEFREVEPHAFHIALIGTLMYYALTAPAREAYLRSGQAPTTTDPVPASYVAEIRELFVRGLRPDAR